MSIYTGYATLLGCNSVKRERIDSEKTTGMNKDFASDFSLKDARDLWL